MKSGRLGVVLASYGQSQDVQHPHGYPGFGAAVCLGPLPPIVFFPCFTSLRYAPGQRARRVPSREIVYDNRRPPCPFVARCNLTHVTNARSAVKVRQPDLLLAQEDQEDLEAQRAAQGPLERDARKVGAQASEWYICRFRRPCREGASVTREKGEDTSFLSGKVQPVVQVRGRLPVAKTREPFSVHGIGIPSGARLGRSGIAVRRLGTIGPNSSVDSL